MADRIPPPNIVKEQLAPLASVLKRKAESKRRLAPLCVDSCDTPTTPVTSAGMCRSISEVIPGLYLSSSLAAAEDEALLGLGINLVIDAAASVVPCSTREVVFEADGSGGEAQMDDATIERIAAAVASAVSEKRVVVIWIRLLDKPCQSLKSWFAPVAALAHLCRTQLHTGLLVHCLAGVSRSVSLVASILLINHWCEPRTLERAMELIKAVRPSADPIITFRLELFALERALSRSSSASCGPEPIA